MRFSNNHTCPPGPVYWNPGFCRAHSLRRPSGIFKATAPTASTTLPPAAPARGAGFGGYIASRSLGLGLVCRHSAASGRGSSGLAFPLRPAGGRGRLAFRSFPPVCVGCFGFRPRFSVAFPLFVGFCVGSFLLVFVLHLCLFSYLYSALRCWWGGCPAVCPRPFIMFLLVPARLTLLASGRASFAFSPRFSFFAVCGPLRPSFAS